MRINHSSPLCLPGIGRIVPYVPLDVVALQEEGHHDLPPFYSTPQKVKLDKAHHQIKGGFHDLGVERDLEERQARQTDR